MMGVNGFPSKEIVDASAPLAEMKYFFPLHPYNQQRQFEKPVWVYPAHLAMYATHLRNQGHEVQWGGTVDLDTWGGDRIIFADWEIDVPFAELPFPDRVFTEGKHRRWQSYGNYKFHPATHMMASNLCWYGKCTFCIDTAKLEAGEKRGVRSVDHVIAEIDELIAQGYKEVFDDSGTFPVGDWLEEFCEKMQSRKKKIRIGCNMKPIRLDYKKMGAAGFRFILVGIESANQETLDRIKKGQHVGDIIPIIRNMNAAGLEVHLTTMFGYPWESHEDAMRTVNLVHYLLESGYAKTAQASVYSPPRTAPDPTSPGHRYIRLIYDAYKSPRFWLQKVRDIRRWEDITYLCRGARLVVEEKFRK